MKNFTDPFGDEWEVRQDNVTRVRDLASFELDVEMDVWDSILDYVFAETEARMDLLGSALSETNYKLERLHQIITDAEAYHEEYAAL